MTNARYSLFIDDERFPPRNDGRKWVIARDFEEVMMSLRRHGMPGYISFDHDLGDVDKHTGYDIAKLLVELDMAASDPLSTEETFPLPDDFEFYVHSQNPIGKKNIESYLNNYLRIKHGTD